MPFNGEIQSNPYMCVFASIVGAVNNLAGRPVWTQETLLAAWRAQGIRDNDLNFGNIFNVAIEPVRDLIEAVVHSRENEPVGEYAAAVSACVAAGGIAVVSLEYGVMTNGNLQRDGAWHMLSLIDHQNETYTAWDTAGEFITLTESQLTTSFNYGSKLLMVHAFRDALFFRHRH